MLTAKSFSNVTFIKSITHQKDIPKPNMPEIAFAGRSNVGKSSLLNAIFNRKNMVKTSSTPGKTQLINFFNIDNSFYCVDLPGYGYAKIPKQMKIKWQAMIENYILNSKNLTRIFLLIDSRHTLMENDMQMIQWLESSGIKFSLILSKFDKLKKSEQSKTIDYFSQLLPVHSILPFSIKDESYIKQVKHNIISNLR